MSVLKPAAAEPAAATVVPSEPWESHTARFCVHWGRSGAVVSVVGELDAANADDLANYVQRCAAYCEWLVLDLTELEFMGTAGFSVLHTINTRCAGTDVQWALVPGAATTRLLRICDPDTTLPTAKSGASALARVQDRRLLQLVPQPG